MNHPRRSVKGYRTWIGINRRCLDSSDKNYPRYGGKGIAVCERWRRGTPGAFNNFIEDMGEKPNGRLSIDRIDNNKGYEPSNCRWATQQAQQNNRGDNVRITISNRTATASEWGRETGINPGTILYRWRRGVRGAALLKFPSPTKARYITIDGEPKRISEWATISGVSANTIRLRLNNGIDPKTAVYAPADRGHRVGGGKQNQNRKDCVFLEVGGETHHVAEWARLKGLAEDTIRRRLKKGWSPEKAVTTPARKKRKS